MSMTGIVAAALLALSAPQEGEAEFRPSPAEGRVPALYRLEPARFPYQLRPLRRVENQSVHELRFPSPIATPNAANNTVVGEYFSPQGPGRRPAVVVLHILGADFPLSRYVAARLAERGVAALFIRLPYYGERRPDGGAQRFLSADIERSLRSMRQGVCDVRRAAAWLRSRPEVDPQAVGAVGISLGGIVAALSLAVDPELDRGAFLLAGGDLARILWEMPEGAKYKDLWIRSGRTLEDLRVLTGPYDPLTYADRLRGKRVLMIAGRVDEVIPPESARALWDAAGRPPIRWYDCGHYSAAGYLLPGIRAAVDFLAADNPQSSRAAPSPRHGEGTGISRTRVVDPAPSPSRGPTTSRDPGP